MSRALYVVLVSFVLTSHWSAVLARGKARSNSDACFSESVPPDRRIASCSAAIRSTQSPSAKASAFLNRAAAYGQKGEYGRAAEDSTQAIERAPSAAAYYTRALAYLDMGKDEQAIEDCNAALGIDPKSENALFIRGSARQNLADYLNAIKDYTEVLRLDPGRADTVFARGTAYFSAGEYRAAVADFNKTIEFGRADPAVLYLRDLAESEIRNRSDDRSDSPTE